MPKRKTQEEFEEKICSINKNILILGTYINSRSRIKCKCKIDDTIWYPFANDLIKGHGCPKCAGLKKLTNKEFVDNLNKQNPNIYALDKYVSAQTPIRFCCKIDKYVWTERPYAILNLHEGCPKCAGNNKISHADFVNRIYKLNQNIEILSEYKNIHNKVQCRCKIDNNLWNANPKDLLDGCGCPKCASSKGEKRIDTFLSNNSFIYKTQYRIKECRNKMPLPFDFSIFEDRKQTKIKCLIEYDGEQHYKPWHNLANADKKLLEVQKHDNIKTEYCKEHNIKLIRIPYWDYDNIEKILNEEIN
mgnify:CR=1 FL=1